MADTPAEVAGETVTAVVEGALAAAEASVIDANERADAAREAAALITEAAIERAISDRVDTCEEGIEQCENHVEALQNQVATLQRQLTEMATAIPQLVTQEILMAELAKLSLPPLTPKPSPQPEGTISPSNPDAAGDAPKVPEAPQKPNRYRLT